MPKPMPALTVAAAVPPNRERVYFDNCSRFPFAPHARDCHLGNAWWLAEAAFAAYEDFARTDLPLIDLSPIRMAGYQVHSQARGSTQWLTLEGPEAMIVAFRGTRLDERTLPWLPGRSVYLNWADTATDARFLPVPIASGVHVHGGFMAAYRSIEEDLAAVLSGADRAGKPVWLCGHSLGGALATLAAYHHPGTVSGLYTFGSPKVGNPAFVRTLEQQLPNLWRFVHHRDIVPALPPAGLPTARRYAHAGRLKVITGGDTWRIEDETPGLPSLADLAAAELAHARKVKQAFHSHFSLTNPASWPITFEGIADHSPLYYTNKIFNALEESLC